MCLPILETIGNGAGLEIPSHPAKAQGTQGSWKRGRKDYKSWSIGRSAVKAIF